MIFESKLTISFQSWTLSVCVFKICRCKFGIRHLNDCVDIVWKILLAWTKIVWFQFICVYFSTLETCQCENMDTWETNMFERVKVLLQLPVTCVGIYALFATEGRQLLIILDNTFSEYRCICCLHIFNLLLLGIIFYMAVSCFPIAAYFSSRTIVHFVFQFK